MNKLAVAGATMASLFAFSFAHAGDAALGRSKAESCLGCHAAPHQVNTYPTYHVPKLGGQHQEYLVAALQAYRANQRPHQTMHANAASLSDEDIADIAAYLSSLK